VSLIKESVAGLAVLPTVDAHVFDAEAFANHLDRVRRVAVSSSATRGALPRHISS
jgi:hypothetical protein